MKLLLRCLSLILALLAVCPAATAEARRYTALEADALSSRFAALTPAPTLKAIGYDAPVMTQRLGADPWALVDGDRVYLYMTADVVERGADGAVRVNAALCNGCGLCKQMCAFGCITGGGEKQ